MHEAETKNIENLKNGDTIEIEKQEIEKQVISAIAKKIGGNERKETIKNITLEKIVEQMAEDVSQTRTNLEEKVINLQSINEKTEIARDIIAAKIKLKTVALKEDVKQNIKDRIKNKVQTLTTEIDNEISKQIDKISSTLETEKLVIAFEDRIKNKLIKSEKTESDIKEALLGKKKNLEKPQKNKDINY